MINGYRDMLSQKIIRRGHFLTYIDIIVLKMLSKCLACEQFMKFRIIELKMNILFDIFHPHQSKLINMLQKKNPINLPKKAN